MRSVLGVNGMTCHNCVKHVTEALQELPGVDEVEVSLENRTATVDHDPDVTTVEELAEAVVEAGYEVGLT